MKKVSKERIKPFGRVEVRSYEVFVRAVEEGIGYGWHRAHKHTDRPGEDTIKDEILQAVTVAVCEFFEFFPEPPAG